VNRLGRAALNWWFTPVPAGRVAAFRTLVYLFVPVDVFLTTPWVDLHADVPGRLYDPLVVGNLLHLPTPTYALVETVKWLLVALAVAAATGRAPRLLGTAVFVLYFEWMIIAMSYGKVDHDRFGYLVALAVLPTAGRARHGDPAPSEAAGWAFRCVQIGVISTYFLAAWAKMRFGGIGWFDGATIARAVLRRGTFVSDWLTHVRWILVATQWGIILFEFASVLVLFLKPRWQYFAVAFFAVFHLVTWVSLTIIFLPHLVAMTSFLPLEKVRIPTFLDRGPGEERRKSGFPVTLGVRHPREAQCSRSSGRSSPV
jgi:hypothetical protein